ncbi:hypothetical protein PIB30_025092 [Stylosanthes scabra]|uniref:Thioredoxin domain-containing protein n=1 Tax=Stylosanthes scabra TaxID=79078 RepID=A0ABU6VA61_9FABA|nr:hypothetical protein [Stylosanthes scabra]
MADEGLVIGCHTVDAWKQQLDNAQASNELVVVDFTASWCGPCRIMAPILEDLAKKMPDVRFLKVDVDELNSVAEEWNIEAMPTFLFLKQGQLLDKVVGAEKDQLQQTLTKHASS